MNFTESCSEDNGSSEKKCRTKSQIESSVKKPKPCKIHLDSIPQELKDRNQWVLWGYRRRKGKWTKVPYQPGGQEAKADDPSTWTRFDHVLQSGRLATGQYDGIGYEFSEDDPYTGIDLDDAIDLETNQLKLWAQAIINQLDSYTEKSPSGTGVKIWVKAKKPSNDRSRTKWQDGEVEMYDHGRYFAVTGQHWPGTPGTIEDRQAEVAVLYHQLFAKKEKKKPEREPSLAGQPETRSLADDELIQKATKAKNGDKFSRLFAGDTSDYDGDDSRADAALCGMLAFWTDRDFMQVDRIFRSSGLMRAKWDERRGEGTYGQRTIDEACSLVQETYRGRRRLSLNMNSLSTNGDGHSTNGDGNGHHPKPIIILGTDEYRLNNQAIEALSDPVAAPEVFQRGNMLVRVLRTAKAGKQKRIDRPEGTPRISAMPAAFVCELLTRVADFLKPVTTKKGGEEFVPAHPPDRCVAAVVARGEWPSIRPLEGVIEAPTIRPDWTVLETPGWDAETGLLYEPNAEYPSILPTPTKKDAIESVERLLDLIRDFPFAGTDRNDNDKRNNHRSAWLAALLTAVVRHAIAGPCPLFLFDANCPGTGKSMLSDIISLIATGRVISRTTFPNNDEELRKRLTAVALAGDRLLLFDNIEAGQPFGGASLDAALTGTTWQDRLLGRSKMTPELPLHTVFFATGNNVILKGDALRRVLPCRLETKEENPEEREGFKYPNLSGHVRLNRPRLICDVLTILRGYAVAGCPEESLPAFGSYEAWSSVVRQTVFWVMGVDPWSTRKGLRASDPALNNLSTLLEGWAELPGGTTGLTVAEALRILSNPDRKDDYLPLRAALMDWSRNDKLPGAGQIGCKLRSLRHRVVNGKALDSDTSHGGGQCWRIVPANAVTAFGDDGDDGDDA